MAEESSFAARYDLLVLDPFMRQYFGPAGYFNAGYWRPDTICQEQACSSLAKRLIESLPERAARILDVGCGLGATTRELARLRPQSEIVALNISHPQLTVCRRACPGAHLFQSDAASVPLQAECLDAILSVEAAFHFRTRETFFREARRILKPGGSLVLSDILFQPQPWPGAWTVPAGNALEGPKAYEEIVRSAGFEQIRIEDATEPCWRGFCNNLERWLSGTASGNGPWVALARDLRGAVSHYLLASAERAL